MSIDPTDYPMALPAHDAEDFASTLAGERETADASRGC
jgi:hypothetical protein